MHFLHIWGYRSYYICSPAAPSVWDDVSPTRWSFTFLCFTCTTFWDKSYSLAKIFLGLFGSKFGFFLIGSKLTTKHHRYSQMIICHKVVILRTYPKNRLWEIFNIFQIATLYICIFFYADLYQAPVKNGVHFNNTYFTKNVYVVTIMF